MAEEEATYRVDAETSQAEKAIDRLIDRVADLNEQTNHTDKNLQQIERASVKTGTQVKKLAGDFRESQQEVSRLSAELRGIDSSLRLPASGMTAFGKNTRATKQEIADATRALREYQQVANKQVANRNLKNQPMLYGQEGVERILGREYDLGAAGQGNAPFTQMGAFYQNQKKAAAEYTVEADRANRATGSMFATFRQGAQSGGNEFSRLLEQQRTFSFQQFQAQQEAQQWETAFDGLANTRYALYDVARALTIVSAATLGLSVAAIKTEADFENFLISVKRTSQATGEEWEQLRSSIIGLTTEIPASIEEVSAIATLAGQLGIATDQIDEFTEAVIKFSSTTDVTAEEAAEKIGRVAQLAGAGAGEYDNLAASIYQVGITSVSTESDILSVAEQISVSARQAGFATEQTVALASALASLGVAPERARGSIQRIFSIITNAVDNGSDELDQFAAVTGTSAERFAEAWKGDPQQAFFEFLEGLGAADKAGESMDNTLRELGISAVRDTDALKRLAQNTEVYTKAISEANEGWVDGSVFSEGYAEVADTLNNQLKTLWNTLKAIVEAAQDNGALKAFVGVLQDVAEAVFEFVSTPIGKTVTALVMGAGVLVGTFALVGAGLAGATASVYAMITALKFATKQHSVGIGVTKLARQALIEYAVAARGASAASLQGASNAGVLRVALFGVYSTARATAVAIRGIKYALVSTGVGIALVALGEAIAWVWEKLDGGEPADSAEQLQKLSAAVKEDTAAWEELGKPLNDDAFKVVTGEVETSTDEIVNNTDAVNNAFGSNVELADAVGGVTETLAEQSVALGENSQAWLRNAIAQGFLSSLGEDDPYAQAEGIDNLTSALEAYGWTLDDLITQAQAGNPEAQAFLAEMDNISAAHAALTPTVAGLNELAGEQIILTQGQVQALKMAGDEYGRANTAMENAAKLNLAGAEANEVFGSTLGEAGDEAYDAATDTEALADELDSLVDNIFAVVDSRGAFLDALSELGAGLHENGNDFSVYSEEGRSNLANLKEAFATAVQDADGDAQVLASSVESIIAGVEAAGGTGVRNLQVVRDMLAYVAQDIANAQAQITGSAHGGVNTYGPRGARAFSNSVLSNSLNNPSQGLGGGALLGVPAVKEANNALKVNEALADQVALGFDTARRAANESGNASKNAGKEAAEAQKEVRTLSDYISDLSSVAGDAFNFRFGYQTSVDGAADALQKIGDALEAAKNRAADLRETIRGLQVSLKSLAADRRILEYHLKVARDYGDTLREQEIVAELAENEQEAAEARADAADATKDLQKEQQFLSRDLEGSTQESREHRDMVRSLTKSYQDQIIAYADTGASQQEVEQYARKLRGEFESQLRQLGYNQRQIDTYSLAFDDLVEIIQELPRNITVKVSASTSPAQRALNEFFAKNKDKTITTTQNVKTKYSTSGSSVNPKNARGQKLTAEIMSTQALADRLYSTGSYKSQYSYYQSLLSSIKSKADRLASGNYWTGGYTGDEGARTPVGVVHGKEFVFDAQSTAAIGPNNLYDMMQAAKRGSFTGFAGQPTPVAVSGMQGTGTMNLSALSIQMLAAAIKPVLAVDGMFVGGVTSKSYQEMSQQGAS